MEKKINKYQDALDFIKGYHQYYCEEWLPGDEEEIKKGLECEQTLQELIDRATPKKISHDGFYHSTCPICGTQHIEPLESDDEFKYCPMCGQALDWSQDER